MAEEEDREGAGEIGMRGGGVEEWERVEDEEETSEGGGGLEVVFGGGGGAEST